MLVDHIPIMTPEARHTNTVYNINEIEMGTTRFG